MVVLALPLQRSICVIRNRQAVRTSIEIIIPSAFQNACVVELNELPHRFDAYLVLLVFDDSVPVVPYNMELPRKPCSEILPRRNLVLVLIITDQLGHVMPPVLLEKTSLVW